MVQCVLSAPSYSLDKLLPLLAFLCFRQVFTQKKKNTSDSEFHRGILNSLTSLKCNGDIKEKETY